MCADSSNFFKCPAYKLLLSDIKSAVLKNPHLEEENDFHPDSDSDPDYEWTLKVTSIPGNDGRQIFLKCVNESKPCLELDLRLVWVQGTVLRLETNEENETLSLVITDDDGEHEAVIYEYNTVPGGDHPDIKTGSYVGALGQIWSNDPKIVLKATKLMHLSGNPLHRSMWKDEVSIGKAFLAGLISPTI